MSSTVNQAIINVIMANSYERLSLTFGVIVVVLLLALLILKEVGRAYSQQHTSEWSPALDIAVGPLLISFSLIIILRLIALLYPL